VALQTAVAPGPDRVRIRPARIQQLSFAVVPVMDVVVLLMPHPFVFWPPIVFVGVFTLEFLYLCFGAGITLTADTAIVHNIRRRRIAWANVQGIQIEPYMGCRTIVIYEANGRRTRLRTPTVGFLNWDKRFDEKYHTIGQWWLAHRGEDWNQSLHAAWTARAEASQQTWMPMRIRPAGTQTAPILMTLACLILETIFGAMLSSLVGRCIGGLVILVLILAMWQFGLRAGVTLTPDHLDVRNLRRRTLPWNEISSITFERTWRGTRLVVQETTGRRTRLSGPRIGLFLWDRGFEVKAQTIHRWWGTYREAGDGDGHLGLPLPLEFTGRTKPRFWKVLLVSLFCLALSYFLLVGALVMALASLFS